MPEQRRTDPPKPLTVKRIERIKTPGRYRDGAVKGLILQWASRRSASWVLRYEKNGRERWLGLGSLADVPLQEARDRANKARKDLRDPDNPIDLIEARRQARTAKQILDTPTEEDSAKPATFEQMAERFYDSRKEKWSNEKAKAQFLSTLRAYVFPVIGSKAIAEITVKDVKKCLEPIWKTKHETANRVRGRIAAVWQFGHQEEVEATSNHRPAQWEKHSGINPAAWSALKSKLLSRDELKIAVKNHPALAYRELPEFFAALAQREGEGAKALMFTILTAARVGEVVGMKWAEVDLANATWTIPAERMKARKEHRVSLAPEAVALLRANRRGRKPTDFVFQGDRKHGLTTAAMPAVLRRMGRDDITCHGFRASYRTWCAEQTEYPREISERSLAHTIEDKSEQAYMRGDHLAKRRALAADWSAFCHSAMAQLVEAAE